MENRLDELFKNKLEHHVFSPSQNVWTSIEANLVKKNSPLVVWRLAAALLLMGCLLTALYWTTRDNNLNSNSSIVQTIEPVQIVPIETEKQKAKVEEKKATTKIHRTALTQTKRVESQVTEVESEPTVILTASAEPVELTANEVNIESTTPTVTVTQTEKPIVLEFTLAPIETVVTAQTEEKNSGLKKFFIKAKELKNGESGINLADFANRLFASNHKQDQEKNILN
ncbi:MAG: hypothetical protein HOP37_08790 [Cyclobacteriaceae bacterium]|nr:hypothetical protein [Cyclobacteriaceae bacterium]